MTIGGGNVVASSISSNQYALPGRPGAGGVQPQQQQVAQPQALYKAPPNSAPPLPEPDYSLSESDPDEDNSVRLVRTLKKTNGDLKASQNPGMAAETSGNSNTSGSSTGSSSMPHSFSVEEIQKIRTKLKSSKSYPNDFLRKQNSQQQASAGAEQGGAAGVAHHNEEGDNSSSGVSSDQEVTITCNDVSNPPPPKQPLPKQPIIATAPKPSANVAAAGAVASGMSEPKKVTLRLGPTADEGRKEKPVDSSPERRSDVEENDDADGTDSPSPPATGFQRHNSLTRKQAATLAANRAKANQQNLQQRHAVTLATLPPPIEADSDEADSWSHPLEASDGNAQLAEGAGMVVLAPPPEFSDATVSQSVPGSVSISVQSHHSHQHTHQHHQHQHQHVHHHHQHSTPGGSVVLGHNPNCKRVRIVGAVPKVNRMNSQ